MRRADTFSRDEKALGAVSAYVVASIINSAIHPDVCGHAAYNMGYRSIYPPTPAGSLHYQAVAGPSASKGLSAVLSLVSINWSGIMAAIPILIAN